MRRFAVIWAAILILTAAVALTARTAYNAQAHQNATVREGWCYTERAILNNPKTPPEERRKTAAFFNGLTRDLNVDPCVITPSKGGH